MTITYHIDDINQVARQILDHSTVNTFIFNAPMGAGKTTLITAMCKQLGVTDEISSPTFSLVNEYQGSQRDIFHFDLYRLEDEEELFNIGIEDYLSKNAAIFIEWPELVMPYLEKYVELNIEILDPFTRKATLILS
ncbi:MAG: tRNA (adenosine(37)-N6)-threonylcarbamoyltransferase complex ATPase subunit type 1 TsaE [Nonlabens sp.]|uniref:tRNA (adenosine(37)-N6)-threonylcarbamoyltransferase complex ATPase subunit type 1 TsaE n=1 Tax=Nonlabens sp. TaxID=1888209 RepID=UPI003EF43205